MPWFLQLALYASVYLKVNSNFSTGECQTTPVREGNAEKSLNVLVSPLCSTPKFALLSFPAHCSLLRASLRWSVSKQKEFLEVNSPFLEQKIKNNKRKHKPKANQTKSTKQWTNNDDNRNHTRDRLIRLSSFVTSVGFLVSLFFQVFIFFFTFFMTSFYKFFFFHAISLCPFGCFSKCRELRAIPNKTWLTSSIFKAFSTK